VDLQQLLEEAGEVHSLDRVQLGAVEDWGRGPGALEGREEVLLPEVPPTVLVQVARLCAETKEIYLCFSNYLHGVKVELEGGFAEDQRDLRLVDPHRCGVGLLQVRLGARGDVGVLLGLIQLVYAVQRLVRGGCADFREVGVSVLTRLGLGPSSFSEPF